MIHSDLQFLVQQHPLEFSTDVGQRKLHYGIFRLLQKKVCAGPIKLFG